MFLTFLAELVAHDTAEGTSIYIYLVIYIYRERESINFKGNIYRLKDCDVEIVVANSREVVSLVKFTMLKVQLFLSSWPKIPRQQISAMPRSQMTT